MKKHKFTLIELLVVVAIIGILAALIFPALGRAKKKSLIGTCRANLKNIGTIVSAYYTDGKVSYLPVPWLSSSSPIEFEDQLLTCPLRGKINGYQEHADSPGGVQFLGNKSSALAEDKNGVDAHEGEKINVVYQDGSVQTEAE